MHASFRKGFEKVAINAMTRWAKQKFPSFAALAADSAAARGAMGTREALLSQKANIMPAGEALNELGRNRFKVKWEPPASARPRVSQELRQAYLPQSLAGGDVSAALHEAGHTLPPPTDIGLRDLANAFLRPQKFLNKSVPMRGEAEAWDWALRQGKRHGQPDMVNQIRGDAVRYHHGDKDEPGDMLFGRRSPWMRWNEGQISDPDVQRAFNLQRAMDYKGSMQYHPIMTGARGPSNPYEEEWLAAANKVLKR